MSFSCHCVETRKFKNTTYKKSNVVKKNTNDDEDKIVRIPKFFEFDLSCFKKENYYIYTDVNNKINIYVTPLIRTILNDLRNNNNCLATHIKERMNSNARLLIKKSLADSKEITIHNKRYLKINANFSLCNLDITETNYLIMNDKKYLSKEY